MKLRGPKAQLMDKEALARAIKRISHEISEKNKDGRNLAIVGIQKRGANLAARIASSLKEITGIAVPVGVLDITLYRDDLTQIAEQPVVHSTKINFDVSKKNIILVDDVLFTGRTVRCALDELIDFGRPRRIELAVLIDRGHRELPIRADYIGKNVPTALDEDVRVRVEEVDGVDEVVVERRGKK